MSGNTGTGKYEQALTKCRHLDPIPTAVAHPCDENSLTGALEAAANGLIVPILVGPNNKIREVADRYGLDISKIRIVNAAHSHDSGGWLRRASVRERRTWRKVDSDQRQAPDGQA